MPARVLSRSVSPQLAADGSPQPAPFAASYRLLTRLELRLLVPYTPQHVLRLEKRGLFPRRIQVGPNRVAWLLDEVEAWIATRLERRDNRPR